jgi:hypothetical protein
MVRSELRTAVQRLSADGARVAILNVPPTVDGELRPIDPDEQTRRAHYNEVLREVADADPDHVSWIDFASMVCGGRPDDCAGTVDDIELRPLDGSHFEDQGALWVAQHLSELVLDLDLDAPASPSGP